MIDSMVILSITEFFSTIGFAIMQPLYWAISGLLTAAHWLVSPLFGRDSGLTWVLSILCLTIVIRGLLTPLYAKQLNSSRVMQTLQPKIKALQDKYGSDRERLGQETMKLYQEEGFSPASSCLPILVQLPIFWALFRVLNYASRGHAVGYFFVHNPALVDSLSNASVANARLSGTFLPLSNGFGATQLFALVLIVAMTSILVFQQMHMMRRNMPPSALEGPFGQQQKMLLYMMPIMFVFGGLAMPIGVLIYWTASNVWTLIQQWIIIRTYPTPGTPAYVDWEERMIAKGKDPKAIERMRLERGRKKPRTTTVTATDENGRPKVARQKGVNRTTNVQHDEQGRQIIQRQQVRKQSRAQRKKK